MGNQHLRLEQSKGQRLEHKLVHPSGWKWEIINEKSKLRDKIKDEYCKDRNIKIKRIPYYDIKNIKNLVESFIKDIVLTM